MSIKFELTSYNAMIKEYPCVIDTGMELEIDDEDGHYHEVTQIPAVEAWGEEGKYKEVFHELLACFPSIEREWYKLCNLRSEMAMADHYTQRAEQGWSDQ